ncbi:hypothetical protein XELAEV_18007033mg [Xenopus laevis]|uniref:Uncharacterized protein n=1 Tax=Xenopus laevis TaxID=8355 RepID=A0A974E0R8_XENLA|nr:hypothetical protein XELAEV_18007033mg [Xenopus laevis]
MHVLAHSLALCFLLATGAFGQTEDCAVPCLPKYCRAVEWVHKSFNSNSPVFKVEVHLLDYKTNLTAHVIKKHSCNLSLLLKMFPFRDTYHRSCGSSLQKLAQFSPLLKK